MTWSKRLSIWLIGIIDGLEGDVAVLKVGYQDVSVLEIKIIKYVAIGYI